MSSFEITQGQFNQQHFTIVELDLPVIEGTCTISSNPGYGTPLSCDEPSDAIRTYKFTNVDAPILPESGILRILKSVEESPAILQPGKGLAVRGSGSITLTDVTGVDPNPDAPAVTADVIAQGTFLGKMSARNVITNRERRIKNYRVESDGSVDLAGGAETRYYIANSLEETSSGIWKVTLKDELSRANIGESVWPIPLEGSLRTGVNDTDTTIQVDANVTYVIGMAIRIADEFMKVTGISGIGTGSAELTVQTRGNDIVYTNTLTTTVNESHDAGDEIFVCEVSDDERIDDLLERILLDIGIDGSLIPKLDWTAEVDEWHPTTRIDTLWIESLTTDAILESILSVFMIDMWFDPVAREIKISAISVWKESTSSVTENIEINFESITRRKDEQLRVTRALVIYNKLALATPNSVENYNKASIFRRTELEAADLYGEPKTRRFPFSAIISDDAADLLVQRFVSRFTNPFRYSWVTPENKRTFEVGDVVDINSSITVGFDGISSGTERAQIISIKPKYTPMGRDYMVKAISYEPVFSSGSEIVITGTVSDINLYIQYAGAPSTAVTITFVFDAANAGSTSSITPAIRAGAFPAGSKIIIIMVNSADLQAKGGGGGRGGSLIALPTLLVGLPTNGSSGSIVYDAEGIDTDIYFSGATSSAAFPVANGFLRAPSGGGGGFDPNVPALTSGDGGDGGDGRSIGDGGDFGPAAGTGIIEGANGADGSEGGGNLGVAGANNNAVGGLAGSGVVDSGATVVFFGDTPARYVNGNGDH